MGRLEYLSRSFYILLEAYCDADVLVMEEPPSLELYITGV